MDRRVAGRRYGIEIGNVKLTPLELSTIQSTARAILLDEQGFDVARAWVTATIRHLIKTGVLPDGSSNPKFGETT